MVSSPVFLLTVGMLAISDAAPPKPPTFLELIEHGRRENIDALNLWNDLPLTGKADLMETNKIFDQILKDEQGDHYYPLKKALRHELRALKEKKKCKSLSKKEKRDETACKVASSKISVSLVRIVAAIRETVPEQNWKDRIDKIVKKAFVIADGNLEKAARFIGKTILSMPE
ncbi:hypothetical protein Q1695_004343 [Nippostrongylus brasiliensis]|nr:hypothetical protein Q1695_004343 [Nippostrongylus brasiliensis]